MKLEATIGDKLVLYRNGKFYKKVTITQRLENDIIWIDTIDESGSYGNTNPTYKTVLDLLISYDNMWNTSTNSFEILRSNRDWSDLLSGETLWLTKCELDEVLLNLKALNINTLNVQSCKDKFVVKVDEATVKEYMKQTDVELNISLINNSTISFESNTRGLRSKIKGIDIL